MSALIVLCTDKGFLVPSLVVASQVRQQHHNPKPDIKIYLSDFTDEEFDGIKSIADALDIEFVRVSTDILSIDGSFEHHFQKGISPTALMRLAICELIPDHYDNIVYLDGDMQVLGSLSKLLDNPPPEGKIAAVAECYVILRNRDNSSRPWVIDYLRQLGLNEERQYFNSGMMSFKVSTWKKLAPKALKYYRENPDNCPNYDQSALNAVVQGNWLHIHPAYNWQSFFNHLAGDPPFRKRIVHFTSRPKPWQEAQTLWSQKYYTPYADILDRFTELQPFLTIKKRVTLVDKLKYLFNRSKVIFRNSRYRRWLKNYLKSEQFHFDL